MYAVAYLLELGKPPIGMVTGNPCRRRGGQKGPTTVVIKCHVYFNLTLTRERDVM